MTTYTKSSSAKSSLARGSALLGNLDPLEPRYLLDAAGVAAGAEVAADVVAEQQAEEAVTGIQATSSVTTPGVFDALEITEQTVAGLDSPSGLRELIFVDSRVTEYGDVMARIDPSAQVIGLDAGKDGVGQMAAVLGQFNDVRRVHIVAGGDAGSLQLGNATLNLGSMGGRYAPEMARLGEALSEDGDIRVYGATFGSGELGRDTVDRLALLTGADVVVPDLVIDSRMNGNVLADWLTTTEQATVPVVVNAPLGLSEILLDQKGDIRSFAGIHAMAGEVLDETPSQCDSLVRLISRLMESHQPTPGMYHVGSLAATAMALGLVPIGQRWRHTGLDDEMESESSVSPSSDVASKQEDIYTYVVDQDSMVKVIARPARFGVASTWWSEDIAPADTGWVAGADAWDALAGYAVDTTGSRSRVTEIRRDELFSEQVGRAGRRFERKVARLKEAFFGPVWKWTKP